MNLRPCLRRPALALAATTAAAGLALGGTAAAQASTSQPAGRETFTVFLSNAPANPVIAFGPVRGRGTDFQVNDTLDVFALPGGSVFVHHSNVNPQPRVNPRTCTATFFTRGFWRFSGRSGVYRNASGQGQFTFRADALLRRLRNGRCDMNLNHEPVFFRGTVNGTGFARR